MRWLDGITNSMDEFEIGVGDGQRSLVCCSPWDRKQSDPTEQLNNNNNVQIGRTFWIFWVGPMESKGP